MVYSATTHLPIPSLPPSTTKSHSFKHMASGSLLSFGQGCDHNCTAVFDKKNVKIFKSTKVNVTALFPPIIQRHCNSPSQPLYSISLPAHPSSIHKLITTINFSSFQDRISFYHGSLLSPTISTWCKAITMVFFNLGLN